MGSVPSPSHRVADADLTALARIRAAAIELFAAQGFAHTTVRSIAERAGVSAALILHHYGSKDGLRAACDAYLLDFLRDEKTKAFTTGSAPTTKAYLRDHPETRPLFDYMTRVLAEGGPTAEAMFDRMVADVRGYLAAGEAAGTVRPSVDEEARAVVHTAVGVSLLLLGPQVARHLGGDQLLDEGVVERYAAVTYELYAHGILTGALADLADVQISRPEIREPEIREPDISRPEIREPEISRPEIRQRHPDPPPDDPGRDPQSHPLESGRS